MDALIVFFALAFVAYAQETTVVTLSKGSLRGYIQQFQEPLSNTNVRLKVFKGIPFAEPPVRFMPPVEKLPWSAEYDATFYRYACPQGYIPLEYVSEDCLFMNIWAPEVILADERLPVMVVIHGGDFQSGAASSDLTSGAPMAAINNVVVVNFNYRLGFFGFGTSDSDLVPGNMGLMDQAMALRWVRENIAAFGGDNNKVTVIGDTAGASSLTLHMVSRGGRYQFDQAIIQDGSLYSYWGFAINRTAESYKAAEVAYRLGCPGGPTYEDVEEREILRCFNEASMQSIIETAVEMANEGRNFLPTIDGEYIPENPYDMIQRGDFKQCPIIGGYSADAGTRDVLYITKDLNRQTPPMLTADDLGVVLSVSGGTISEDAGIQTALQYAVAQQYLDYTKIFREDYDYFMPIVEIHGDAGFTCPLLGFAWTWYNSTSPVYIYELSYAPAISIFRLYNVSTAPWLGATVEEIVQFSAGLGFVPELNLAGFNPPDADKMFALAVMKYFSNFAKSGNPNAPGDVPVQWPEYTPVMQYNLDMGTSVMVEDGPKSKVCHLWNILLPSLRSYLVELTYRPRDDTDTGLSSEWRREFRNWQENNEAWKEAFEAYQEGACK